MYAIRSYYVFHQQNPCNQQASFDGKQNPEQHCVLHAHQTALKPRTAAGFKARSISRPWPIPCRDTMIENVAKKYDISVAIAAPIAP